MRRVGKMSRGVRLAIAATGMVAITGCAPPVSDQLETVTSAITVGTIGDLWTALNNYPNGVIDLNNDIYANGYAWHLGYFAGTLNGHDHTIFNLTTSDTIGQSAAMFVYAEFATIKNLRLVNVTVTGTYASAGLIGGSYDCAVDNVAVEGTASAPNYVGGIIGSMAGGTLSKSYFKGTVTGGAYGAGGLVGVTGSTETTGTAKITSSYAQALNQTSTLVAGSTAAGIHPAGGIVGGGGGMELKDVYAIGAVKGRGSSGGLIGRPTCDDPRPFVLYRGIYRGNVTDSNLAEPGGWAGTLGKATDVTCSSRASMLFFNRDLDTSQNYLTLGNVSQRSSTGAELTAPTAPGVANGGIFCPPSMTLVPCGDDPMTSPPWDYGAANQNNVLMNMPGPNNQIR